MESSKRRIASKAVKGCREGLGGCASVQGDFILCNMHVYMNAQYITTQSGEELVHYTDLVEFVVDLHG